MLLDLVAGTPELDLASVELQLAGLATRALLSWGRLQPQRTSLINNCRQSTLGK